MQILLLRRSSILADVQNHGNPKLPSCKQVLVLGDNESGKTTMIAKLQGVEDPKKGSGLEYAYIDVRDDYRDGKYKYLVFNTIQFSLLKKLNRIYALIAYVYF